MCLHTTLLRIQNPDNTHYYRWIDDKQQTKTKVSIESTPGIKKGFSQTNRRTELSDITLEIAQAILMDEKFSNKLP